MFWWFLLLLHLGLKFIHANVSGLCFSGVFKGIGATAAAGYAAQGSNAQDHLPSAVVQSMPAQERLSGHETSSHPNPGKQLLSIIVLIEMAGYIDGC